jgi:hypothetical protein
MVKRSISHKNLIKLIRNEGYLVREGICKGLSEAGVQSFILNKHKEMNDIFINLNNSNEEAVIEYIKKNKLNLNKFFKTVIYHQSPTVMYLDQAKAGSIAARLELDNRQENGDIQNAMEVWPWIQSEEIKKLGGIAIAEKTIIGAYNMEELKNYFQSLVKVMEEQDVTDRLPLVLGSVYHSIKVGYDPDTKRWVGIDANQLPIKFNLTTEEIAEFVMKGLSTNDVAIFSTSMYSTQSNKENLNKINTAWQEQEKVKNMHQITTDKVNMKDSKGGNLHEIAKRENNLLLVKAIKNMEDDGLINFKP